MVIDYKNKEIIEEIYVHDSVLENFLYERASRRIIVNCSNSYLGKKYMLICNNVIICELQSCLFWGAGNNILGINCSDSKKLHELMMVQTDNKELYQGSLLDQGLDYLCFELQMNSGDTISIVCENLDFREYEM